MPKPFQELFFSMYVPGNLPNTSICTFHISDIWLLKVPTAQIGSNKFGYKQLLSNNVKSVEGWLFGQEVES